MKHWIACRKLKRDMVTMVTMVTMVVNDNYNGAEKEIHCYETMEA